MSDSSEGTSGNVTAVGVSTFAAAVAGTIASSLFSGKESRQQRARKQVDQRLEALELQTSQAMEQLAKVIEGFNVQASGESRRAQRNARDVGKAARRMADRTMATARRQAADLDREALRLQSLERANQLGHDGSRRAKELARQLNNRAAELVFDNRVNLPEWRARTSRSATDAIDKGSILMHQAIDSGQDVRARVAATSSGVVGKTSDAAHHAIERTPVLLETVTRGLGEASHQGSKVAGQVRAAAPAIVDKASKSAHDAVEHARDRVPEVRERAHDVAADASRQVHHLADQAKAQAPVVGAQVAGRLHGARDEAKPVLDDVASIALRLVDSAKEAGSHAGESLIPVAQQRIEAVTEKARSQGHASAVSLSAIGATAGDKLAHTSETIELQSKAAASAAGRGTKDGGSFVMWSVAAAGIIYYAFLDDDQRRKARESGQRIVSEIKEVYRDIRGYDEEFT